MSRLNNSALLIGRIGQEPDIRHTQNGTTVVSFSLATNNKYKNAAGETIEDTEWHRIVCFGKLAEIVQDIAGKGQRVAVRGRITYNEWETKEGVKRKDMQLKCEDFQILSSKSDSSNNTNAMMLDALENLENDDGAIPQHAWNLVQRAIHKAKENVQPKPTPSEANGHVLPDPVQRNDEDDLPF